MRCRKSSRTILRTATLLVCCALFLATAIPGQCGSDDFDNYIHKRVIVHELLGIWEPMVIAVEDVNLNHRIIWIEVAKPMVTGTDTSCQLFAYMMKHLTRTGWIIVVTNDWIPSWIRRIDAAHAQYLIDAPY